MRDAWARGNAEDKISELFQQISKKKDEHAVNDLLNKLHYAYINVKDNDNAANHNYNGAIEALMDLSDLSVINHKGQTPLHISLQLPSFWLTSIFTMAGVNINQKDNDGNTALHFISNISEAEILIAHRADPRIKNNDGKTPIDIASDKGLNDVATLLEKQSTSLDRPKNKKEDRALNTPSIQIRNKPQLTT